MDAAKMYWCGAFCQSAVTLQSRDSGLTLKIWQRMIKTRYKESVIQATSLEVSRQ
jgi:hypothetical protein